MCFGFIILEHGWNIVKSEIKKEFWGSRGQQETFQGHFQYLEVPRMLNC